MNGKDGAAALDPGAVEAALLTPMRRTIGLLINVVGVLLVALGFCASRAFPDDLIARRPWENNQARRRAILRLASGIAGAIGALFFIDQSVEPQTDLSNLLPVFGLHVAVFVALNKYLGPLAARPGTLRRQESFPRGE